ncbi:MAG: EAL domain-containing protein [Gammaproteobacteria bacterium]|nr:EAL domain-containing protein [Gammaproteobacteria bacterium]
MGPGRLTGASSQIRIAFAVTASLVIVVLAVYALYTLNLEQWNRQQRLRRLAGFVAETSRLYFNHYRTGLHFLAADLDRVQPPRRHHVAARLFRHFKEAYPALKAIGVLNARGSAWLPFPSGLPGPSAGWRNLMRRSCSRFRVGSPRRIRLDGHRYIPLCYGTGGPRPLRIMALLPLQNQRQLWAPLALPAGVTIGLLRHGRHMEDLWPEPARPDGWPVVATRRPALGFRAADGHHAAGPFAFDRPYRLGAFHPVRGYPFVAFASMPETTVFLDWWQLTRASLLVLFAALGATYGMYRWALSRQKAWEEERRRGEGQLSAAKERVEVTLRSLLDAVVATDTSGRIQYLNPTAERMTGWMFAEVAGRPLNEVFPCLNEKNGDLLDPVPACLRQEPVGPEDALLLHRDGRALAVERTAAPMRAGDGTVTGVVMVLHDVSEKRLLAARLAHQATHDPLTGLPNRGLFNARLQAVISDTSAQKGPFALLLIDLDGFKRINDTLGHSVGDAALVHIGQKLADALRSTDLLARLGGDEFAVILPHLKERHDVLPIVRKLSAVFAEPALTEPEEIYLGGSIGIAMYPADAHDADGLVRAADMAMYEAKAGGKNTHRFFRPGMRDRNAYLLGLETHLRRALEREELFLLYEPQVSLQAGTLAGFEVLVQWHHPVEGVLPGNQFIPVAEESGLIMPLGAWVLRTACGVKRAWRDLGGACVPMAINLTARQCLHEETPDLVREVLFNSELAPADLVVEVAETVLIQRPAETLSTLRAMKEIGVGLAVDDFGAGLSSLGYLKQVPVDALKIDRSFIHGVPGDQDNEAIVRAIIALGHTLNLVVIGAGVDTGAQYEFLRAAGCDIAQGHYVSGPLAAPEAEAFLRRA